MPSFHKISSHLVILKFFICSMIMLVSACASNDTLHLDNVFDYKRAKQNRLTVDLSKLTQEQQDLYHDLQKKVADSQEIPPELSLLQLPSAFARVASLDSIPAEALSNARLVMPSINAIWINEELDVSFLAGSVEMDDQKIEKIQEKELVEELNEVGKISLKYYASFNQSQSEYIVSKEGNIYRLQVVSRFTIQDHYRSHQRFFYYYTPHYRLDFLIVGDYDKVQKIHPEIIQALGDFEMKLNLLFPQSLAAS